jgi:hypothetical protein
VRDVESLKAELRHVLWLGGAPDAGKTSVAREQARKHGWQFYHLDAAEPSHIVRTTVEQQPTFARFLAMTMDERWVSRTPEEMAAMVVTNSAERFPLVIEDLRAFSGETPLLAEGPWLFPELVAPLLTSPRQALWLNPTVEFKRASAARRDKPAFRHETSDSERATRNWFERDMLLAAHIERQAQEHGLRVVTVDGSRSLEEMVAMVAEHFSQCTGAHLAYSPADR